MFFIYYFMLNVCTLLLSIAIVAKQTRPAKQTTKSGEARCAALHFVLAALNTARRLMPNGSYCHVAQFTDRYLRSRGTTKKNRRLRRLRKRERERERERE